MARTHSYDLAFVARGSSLKTLGWRWAIRWIIDKGAIVGSSDNMQCLAEGMEGAHWGLDFKVRGCITNWSLNTSCVLRGSNLQAWESPQGLLIDEKRKAALDNLYQLISTRVSRGLMRLRSKG